MPTTQRRVGPGPFKYATAADEAHKAAFSAVFFRKRKKERANLDALGFFFINPPSTTHTLHCAHMVALAGGRGQRLYDENVE